MIRAILVPAALGLLVAVAGPRAAVATEAPPASAATAGPPAAATPPAAVPQATPPPSSPVPATPPASSTLAPQPLTATSGTRTYVCETEAFGMDFEPFKRTKGAIRITLDTTAAEPRDATPSVAGPIAGRWRIAGPVDTHVASIAKLLVETCAKGCPFTMTAKGEAQLWAPVPNSLDKLAAQEQLTIAVIKPTPLSVSISTFRGQDIVALEKGTCSNQTAGEPEMSQRAGPALPTPPATPAPPVVK